MSSHDTVDVRAIKEEIVDFLESRRDEKVADLQVKVKKHEPGSPAHADALEKVAAKIAEYEPPTWLANASERAAQIKLATHAVKMTHSRIKGASNFLVATDNNAPRDTLTTASLGAAEPRDAVPENAAVMDVFKFLQLEVAGRTLLERAIDDDTSLKKALSADESLAQQWLEGFASLVRAPESLASHTLARQVYWPIADDTYQLLAPIASSTLSHRIFLHIDQCRFSDAAKTARAARRGRSDSPGPVVEFPDLVAQKVGGEQPQNVSQLNSERRGMNYLLPSLPPTWTSQPVTPPRATSTILSGTFLFQPGVRAALMATAMFLKSIDENRNNIRIRDRRRSLIATIVDLFVAYGEQLQTLTPGWTRDSKLNLDEQCWLDPQRTQADEDFASQRATREWSTGIAEAFGIWLNAELRRRGLSGLSDIEGKEWSDQLLQQKDWLKEAIDHD